MQEPLVPFGVTALVTLRFRKLGSHRAKGKQWFNLIAEIVSASESLGSSLRAPPLGPVHNAKNQNDHSS